MVNGQWTIAPPLTTHHSPLSTYSFMQLDGRPIRQHFRNTLGKLRRVVAHGDDGVGPLLAGVFHHAGVCLRPGVFANLFVSAEVAAENAGKSPTNSLGDGLGPHHNPANNPQVLGNVVTLKSVARCNDHTA